MSKMNNFIYAFGDLGVAKNSGNQWQNIREDGVMASTLWLDSVNDDRTEGEIALSLNMANKIKVGDEIKVIFFGEVWDVTATPNCIRSIEPSTAVWRVRDIRELEECSKHGVAAIAEVAVV